MSAYRVISNDSHINEPRDLWSARAESAFKDRLPQVISAADGSLDPQGRPVGDSWIVDGKRYAGFGGDPKTGVRFEDPSQLLGAHFGPRTFEESQSEEEREQRLGGYFADEHVKDNDIDGIDVSVIYPTLGVFLFGVPDGPLFDSICRILQRLDCGLVQPLSRPSQGRRHDQPRRRVGGRKGDGALPQDGPPRGHDHRLPAHRPTV